jgi:N-acetylmuramoyl-L-alanine amidase
VFALLAASSCGDGGGSSVATTTTSTPAEPPVVVPTTSSSTTTTTVPTTTTMAVPGASGPGALVTPNNVIVPVVGGGPGGWTVTTPCGARAQIASGTHVPAVDVVLDPGHGGREPGALGPKGMKEKDLNLAVARVAQRVLEQRGFRVLLTRTGDQQVTLGTRAAIALSTGARAFVSVHHNAEPDGPSSKPGTETWYQHASPEAKRLGGLVYEEVLAALARYPNVAWVADTDAGAKIRRNSAGDDYYGILRRSAGVPGVLSEAAFITNAPEEDLLAQVDVQEAEATAIANGVQRFLTTDAPGSGFTEAYPRPTPPPSSGSGRCDETPLG